MPQVTPDTIGIYDCEIKLRFRLIEDKAILKDRDRLLQVLLDAFDCGSDDYLEPTYTYADVKEISEVEASPQMRRQLMRLRNAY
jgi:hypothetical protein